MLPPSLILLRTENTNKLCVDCLEVEHARAALEGAVCEHCFWLTLRTPHSRVALFDELGKIGQPHGIGTRHCRGGTASSFVGLADGC